MPRPLGDSPFRQRNVETRLYPLVHNLLSVIFIQARSTLPDEVQEEKIYMIFSCYIQDYNQVIKNSSAVELGRIGR